MGSIAALLVATYISLTASYTCSAVTLSFNSILARASDKRIKLSNCRGVAVIVFLETPCFLIST